MRWTILQRVALLCGCGAGVMASPLDAAPAGYFPEKVGQRLIQPRAAVLPASIPLSITTTTASISSFLIRRHRVWCPSSALYHCRPACGCLPPLWFPCWFPDSAGMAG